MAVNGVQSLMRKFNELGSMEPIVKKAVKKQAEIVRAVAVRLCPVDTGELRGSIYSKVEQDAGSTIGTVYTNKQYAAYVEFGTGPVGQANHVGISPEVAVSYSQEGWAYQDDDGEFHYTNGQAAQPFMYPALKSMENRGVAGLAADLQAGIQKVGGST